MLSPDGTLEMISGAQSMIRQQQSILSYQRLTACSFNEVKSLPFPVYRKSLRIINVHLDEVLIKGVMAGTPADLSVHDQTRRDVNAMPD